MAHPYYEVSANQLATVIFYDVTNRIEYVCETYPQSQTNENSADWRIMRVTYVGATARILRRRWANRSAKFEFNPTLRATYTY